ncbi:MAG: acyl-CoA thioesterase [Carbonactinosporaceae bacterium]
MTADDRDSWFVHPLRVRYHETDGQHIVFNARYLEYFDVAMTEYFRGRGWPYQKMVSAGLDPSLVHTSIDFHRPARFDDELRVLVRCRAIGTTSFTLEFEVLRDDGERLASAEIVYVNLDPATQGARPVPDRFRRLLLPREVRGSAPEGAGET